MLNVTEILQPLRNVPLVVERARGLDRAAERLAKAVERAAPPGSAVNDALSGTAMGEPVHPPLTDVVVGAWTGAVAMDWLGGSRSRWGADWLVALGGLAALPTAAAGLNDWSTLDGSTRRLGLVHGLTNIFATGLFGASWLARKSGHRSAGKLLALAGYGTVSTGAFLGGHLSFGHGVGVDHTAFMDLPSDWTVVADEAFVLEAQPLLVDSAGIELCLVREGESVFAFVDRCAHLGGPLHEGKIVDGCIACPWHASRYRLADGVAISGPTAHPQPTLEVRLRDGKVEVRRRGRQP